MKKWLPLLLVLMAVTISITVVVQTSADDTPEGVLERFVSAYNSLDIEKLLACYEPSTARPMQSMLRLASGLLGVEINDVAGALPILAQLLPDDYGYRGVPRLSYEVHETSMINDNYAVMEVTLTMIYDGRTDWSTGEMHFVKIDGDWYLSEQ